MEIPKDRSAEDLPSPYGPWYTELCAALTALGQEETPPVLLAGRSMQLVHECLVRLCEHVSNHPFDGEAAEIFFFKSVRPKFLQLYLYFLELAGIEARRPPGPKAEVENYLRRHRQNLYYYFIDHAEFYGYMESGATLMDNIYFLRGHKDPGDWYRHMNFVTDSRCAVGYDEIAARILANKSLSNYLDREIRKLHDPDYQPDQKPVLNWSAPKVALVELIYALQSAGVFNRGNADIKQIAHYFEWLFGVELGNFFNTYSEMRLRKKNRTVFLDQLRDTLVRRMDEADAR